MSQAKTPLFVRNAFGLWTKILAHALAAVTHPKQKEKYECLGNTHLETLFALIHEGSAEEIVALAFFIADVENTSFARELRGLHRIWKYVKTHSKKRLKAPVVFADFVEELECAGDVLWRRLMGSTLKGTHRMIRVYEFLERIRALEISVLDRLAHETAPPEKRGLANKRATTFHFLKEAAGREEQKYRLN